MKVIMQPSTIYGIVNAPPSKSLTHRAYICSALANGESTVLYPLICDDTSTTKNILKDMGVKFHNIKNGVIVEGTRFKKPKGDLFCRDSGTTLRLMTPLCALIDGTIKLTAGESLSKRPIGPLLEGLSQLNVQCSSNKGYPPITVKGKGKISGGSVSIPGDISSQFISALLLVSPCAEDPVHIRVTTPLESKPYVKLTLEVLREYGISVKYTDNLTKFTVNQGCYEPAKYQVEGDWSSSSFLLASGALAGKVTIGNLELDSSQADAAIINILTLMGAKIKKNGVKVSVYKSDLHSLLYDISDSPDLFPIVAVLCAVSEGESIISGIRRLIYKESNRIEAMIDGLHRMGVKVHQSGDDLRIQGGSPRGAIINPRKDHRIAMAFAVLGLIAEGRTYILDSECVSKSYPLFWKDMRALDAKYKEELN